MSLSSSDCFLTRRNARTTEGFPKASSNFIAPAHVIRDLRHEFATVMRRGLSFLVYPLSNVGSAIIDGEVVAPAEDGTTDFSVLQNEFKGDGER